MKRSSFTGLRYAVSGGLWGLNFHLPPCWWSQQARTHSRKRPPEKSLLSLRENIRLRRRCIPRSYFLVHCSFPISKKKKLFFSTLFFSDFKSSIVSGAHTQTKSTSGKTFSFASRKFSPSATVLKLFSSASALFFSDFKICRPSEALALSLAKMF